MSKGIMKVIVQHMKMCWEQSIISHMIDLAIESKESNQGILDALLDFEIKGDDTYYIAFDYVVDNQDSLRCGKPEVEDGCEKMRILIQSKEAQKIIQKFKL